MGVFASPCGCLYSSGAVCVECMWCVLRSPEQVVYMPRSGSVVELWCGHVLTCLIGGEPG
jgi:hypothetical protein